MAARTEIDVGEALESQGLGRFQLLTACLCFLVVVVDGLDFGAGNVGAPAILKAFNAEKSQMGLVFGWMYSGILIGSVVFGWIGDRFGRRVALVLAIFMMAIPTGCIGLLPTYAHIGSLAPLLLILLRMIQGASVGFSTSWLKAWKRATSRWC